MKIVIFGLLGVVFVTLKLCDVIAWSWWWVTLPFWGGAAIAIVTIVGLATVTAMMDKREA